MKKNHHLFPTQPVMPDKEKKRIKLMAAMLRYPIGVLIIFQSLFWAWVFRSRFAEMLSLGLGMTCLGIYSLYENIYASLLCLQDCK